MSENASRLEGLKILSVWLSPDEASLAFVGVNEDGQELGVLWETESDCCSETWFADIVGTQALLGATVVKTESIDMAVLGYDVEDGRGRQECDQAYGIKITSTRGWCDVVYRNSSNGYYGGWSTESWFDGKSAPAPLGFASWRSIQSDWGSGESSMPQPIPGWIAESERLQLALDVPEVEAEGQCEKSRSLRI